MAREPSWASASVEKARILAYAPFQRIQAQHLAVEAQGASPTATPTLSTTTTTTERRGAPSILPATPHCSCASIRMDHRDDLRWFHLLLERKHWRELLEPTGYRHMSPLMVAHCPLETPKHCRLEGKFVHRNSDSRRLSIGLLLPL